MKIRFNKTIKALFFFAFLLSMIFILTYNNTAYAATSIKISSVDLTSSLLTEGQKQSYTLVSNSTEKVQYKIYIVNKTYGVWEIASDWSAPVDGNVPYTVTPDIIYKPGDYLVSVWVKRAGTSGLTQNSGGGYDDAVLANFTSSVSQLQISSVKLSSSNIIDGEKQTYTLLSSLPDKVQYKIFIINRTGGIWEIASDWSAPVDGNVPYTVTPDIYYKPGDYLVSVWMKRAGTSGLTQNSGGGYDDSVSANFTSSVSQLQISSVKLSSSSIIEGEKQTYTLLSSLPDKVQYKIFVINRTGGVWEVASDWSAPVDGNVSYTVTPDIYYKPGDYLVSVWMKRAGTSGLTPNSGGGYDDSVSANFISISSKLQLNSVKLTSSNLVEGQKQSYTLLSSLPDKVQYKIFVINRTGGVWEVASDWSAPVDGNVSYTVTPDIYYKPGDYLVSIWVKKAGTSGLTPNSGGGYDDSVSTNFTIIASKLQLNPINISSNILIEGQKQSYTLSTSLPVKVQYKIFIINRTDGVWEIASDWSAPVDGNVPYTVTPDNTYKPGNYLVSVWVKRAGTNGLTPNSGGGYDDSQLISFMSTPVNIQINSVTVTNSDLVQGQKQGFTITANTPEQVQYRIYVLEPGSISYKLIQDWTSPYDGDKPLTITPAYEYGYGSYGVCVWVKKANTVGKNSNVYGSFDSYTNISFNSRRVVTYTSYNYTISNMVDIQYNVNSLISSSSGFVKATKEQIELYANPLYYQNDGYGKYQFMILNYIDGITADELNSMLYGKGVLNNKGAVFLQAAKDNNVNPVYLVAHALLETGNGTSNLAEGILVTSVNGSPVVPKTVYNMFGIHAYDIDPDRLGSEYAYGEGWDTVDKAIIGGANKISLWYINNTSRNQNTLYEMRFNPANPGTYQYASDVAWAYKQIYNIKKLMDMCVQPKLVFDIPVFSN